MAEHEPIRKTHTLPFSFSAGPSANEVCECQQIHWSEHDSSHFGTVHRFIQDDCLLGGIACQCRIQDHRSPIQAGTTKCVHSQLVKHLTRQTVEPQVTILCVQNGRDPTTRENYEIWSRRGC